MLKKLKSRVGLKNVTAGMLLFYAHKSFHQSLMLDKPEHQTIVPIFGCQRSGTSMMTRVFFRDLNAKVYRESSRLSSNDPNKLRLNSLISVRKTIKRNKAPLVVLKPIVESQNVLQFMDVFPETRALWMVRHYRDVAASSLKAFGAQVGISDIQPIVTNDPDNWRSEKVSAYTRSIIVDHYKPDMKPHDAAALFWFARNQLYFEQGLGSNPNVLLCRYEDLTSQPGETMRRIYAHIGRPYPGDQITAEVHAKSVGKGQDVHFSPGVKAICEQMLEKFNTVATAA